VGLIHERWPSGFTLPQSQRLQCCRTVRTAILYAPVLAVRGSMADICTQASAYVAAKHGGRTAGGACCADRLDSHRPYEGGCKRLWARPDPLSVHTLPPFNASHGGPGNAVLPGPISTPLYQASLDAGLFKEEDVAATTCLKRSGTAAEVANLASFLLSTKSSYMTGVPVVIDGSVCFFVAVPLLTAITAAFCASRRPLPPRMSPDSSAYHVVSLASGEISQGIPCHGGEQQNQCQISSAGR
jgi:hypothetical protein